jgi:hypothetical protein
LAGTPYSVDLAVTGGDGSATWNLISGELPAGLSMSTAGAITGTTITAQTSVFTVEVRDGLENTDTKVLSVVILPPAGPPRGVHSGRQIRSISSIH